MSESVKILKQVYDAFERGEISSALNALDPDALWVEPDVEGWPRRGGHYGLAAVAREVFGAIPDHFETFALELEKFIDGVDTVVVTGRLTRLAKGGAELDSPFAHVWQLRDGKVIGFRNYGQGGRRVTVAPI
jgi:uncharacterized protein